MRVTTKFVCQQCGFVSPQWLGKCPECGAWNSLVETVEEKSKVPTSLKLRGAGKSQRPQRLSEIKGEVAKHISTGFEEFDRVLGGGIVPGSVVLLAGDPGVGKSTLLLQVALNLSSAEVALAGPAARSSQGARASLSFGTERTARLENSPLASPATGSPRSILYISGEESAQQIKLRADRLIKTLSKRDVLYILPEVEIEQVVEVLREVRPLLTIVDSIQTMESEELSGIAGSVGQVRECAGRLVRVAKEEGMAIFLVGHVTKEGAVAGPMVLSHMVDTVLFLEGERFKSLRILRSLKNRFGPVDEVGVFRIEQNGIDEVKNPSELFLSEEGVLSKKNIAGSLAVATIEGTRPILVELQALVLPSKLAFPRRVVSGVDGRRVELLCAVLQKQAGLLLDRFDIFVNVAGGLRLSEPGIDLGLCLAIASSLKNVALPKTVAIGEVGLLGEIRRVTDADKREKEAKKLGFTRVVSFRNYQTISEVIQRLLTYGKNKKEN